ncbi:ATP-binding protein [Blastochloris viridis]|uniref:Bipolar DNA helicase HerA n=1 Tax=Blastochloris viridis TaxID=1079 RepID=A0A0H5BQK3_BLAVI|nr:ATP-binding protein [Blastochloris viridis]ALK09041.1 AAA-like domain protein [Blastochloris viridis]BAS01099.1 bipolar DNA helicase HerA [Blastochloris viridis]CUU41703.1 Type IV secretory pathway, VirB4 components [Blastochloris viridis]
MERAAPERELWPDGEAVGRVIDVATDRLVATLTDGAAAALQVDSPLGQIGTYVAVREGRAAVVAMVVRMREEPGATVPAVRTLHLLPVGTLNLAGQFERGVSHYPIVGASVHALGTRDVARMFARFRATNFSVGTVTTHRALPVCLDPSALFGRHVAVLGQTGSGKSWTVTALIQRTLAVMPRAHIVILDLHGEYCWREDDGTPRSAFAAGVARHLDVRELEIPYWMMSFAELCDLLIDFDDPRATDQLAVFRDVLGALKQAEGRRLGLARCTLDTPVYFDFMTLLAAIEQKNGMVPTDLPSKTVRGPLTGVFDNFLMRVNSKLNDVRYAFLLKPRQRRSSDSLAALLRDFVGLGWPRAAVTVIDLSSVPFDVRPIVAAQIGRLAFEFNFWNPASREFPLLLVCEEAHAYVPRADNRAFAGARASMERIAKEGRKYGVGLAVVSQRPHEVSETVLAQCGTFICLRITNPADQDYIRSLVPESEGDLLSVLAGLGRGEALVLGEAVPLPTRLQFDAPQPTPNSNDVDFFRKWRDGPSDLDVEDIVDRWRNQER